MNAPDKNGAPMRGEQSKPSAQGVEVVAWVRFCSDGTHKGPIMDAALEEVRKRSGAWTPLCVAPPPAGGGKEALSDAERLAFVSNSPSRYVEQHPTNNMWRVYEDKAPATAVAADWQAMTMDYHATPSEAIDAAIRAGRKV